MSNDPERPARPPPSPLAMWRWAWLLIREVIDEYQQDRGGDVAAGITFWMLVSIPSGLLALVSALGWLELVVGEEVANDAQDEIETLIRETFVDSTTLQETVTGLFDSAHPGLFTVTTMVAFYTLSRGFAGLIRGLDVAYEVEEGRGWLRLRLVAIALGTATVMVVGGVAIFLVVLAGQGFSSTGLSLAIALTVLVAWATTIFHLAPFRRSPWHHDLPGAVLTAIGWAAAPQAFAIYVSASSAGNQVTTTLGMIVLALMMLYALSVLMLLGAELNDVLTRRSGSGRQLKRSLVPRIAPFPDE